MFSINRSLLVLIMSLILVIACNENHSEKEIQNNNNMPQIEFSDLNEELSILSEESNKAISEALKNITPDEQKTNIIELDYIKELNIIPQIKIYDNDLSVKKIVEDNKSLISYIIRKRMQVYEINTKQELDTLKNDLEIWTKNIICVKLGLKKESFDFIITYFN